MIRYNFDNRKVKLFLFICCVIHDSFLVDRLRNSSYHSASWSSWKTSSSSLSSSPNLITAQVASCMNFSVSQYCLNVHLHVSLSATRNSPLCWKDSSDIHRKSSLINGKRTLKEVSKLNIWPSSNLSSIRFSSLYRR